MTSKELKAMAEIMRANGITYLKTEKITLKMFHVEPVPKVATIAKSDTPVTITPEEEAEIKHKVEEMTSLMKLGDMELAERLFPDLAQEAEVDV